MRGFIARWFFIPATILALGTDAHAECGQNPGCYLDTGKQLLKSNPKRAAEHLLQSYKLDERTDTLILYAEALESDKQYALATETWMRIVTYRESELTATKESARNAPENKSEAARGSVTRARKRAESAAESLIRLSPYVARVRIKLAPGPKPTVTRDGVEVDITHEVVVNAGHDELVFVYTDGRTDKSVVVLQAGENVRIDAPEGKKEAIAKVEPKKEMAKPEPKKPEPKKIEAKPAQPEVAKTEPKKPTLTPKAEPKPSIVETQKSELATSPTTTSTRSRTMSRVGLGLLGGSVVAAGVAGTLGYLAHRDFDRAQAAGCTSDGNCPINTPSVDLAVQSNDRARWAQITGIGAGVLAATGVTLWVLGNKKKASQERMTLRVAPTSTTFAWSF